MHKHRQMELQIFSAIFSLHSKGLKIFKIMYEFSITILFTMDDPTG